MLTKYIDLYTEEIYVNNQKCIGGNCPLQKTAAPVDKIMEGIVQKPEHAYLYVIAMGAGDFYGENKNGDFFYEKDLKDYYKTFEKAGVFIQHNNKNPDKSIGNVLKAIYNDNMHRVELIIEIAKAKAPMIYERAKNGERIAVSMGVKTPRESCSYCGHITEGSLANRCDHLKYMMHQQMPNGQIVYAINHPPLNFFDISIVRKPADTQGYTLFIKTAAKGEQGKAKKRLLTKYIDPTPYSENPNKSEFVAKLVQFTNIGKQIPRPDKEDLDALKNYGKDFIPRVMRGHDIFIMPSESLYLNNIIDYDDIEKMSDIFDSEPFIEHMFENFGEYSPCDIGGDIVVENPKIRRLAARTILIKEAAHKFQNQDAFGNKFRGLDHPMRKKDLNSGMISGLISGAGGAKSFSQIKVNFYDGNSVVIQNSPVLMHGIPEYFFDLVDQGYARDIMGIMANGNEKVIYKGDY